MDADFSGVNAPQQGQSQHQLLESEEEIGDHITDSEGEDEPDSEESDDDGTTHANRVAEVTEVQLSRKMPGNQEKIYAMMQLNSMPDTSEKPLNWQQLIQLDAQDAADDIDDEDDDPDGYFGNVMTIE